MLAVAPVQSHASHRPLAKLASCKPLPFIRVVLAIAPTQSHASQGPIVKFASC